MANSNDKKTNVNGNNKENNEAVNSGAQNNGGENAASGNKKSRRRRPRYKRGRASARAERAEQKPNAIITDSDENENISEDIIDITDEAGNEPEGGCEILPDEPLVMPADFVRTKAPEASEAPTEPVSGTVVIGVRFRQTGKVYYFDPDGQTFEAGSFAIVDTVRGVEYGEVACGNKTVPDREILQPLRKAIRKATPEDKRHFEENEKKEIEALRICADKVSSHGLEMKLIGAEYTFDNTKLLFYFTAEGRVDFRDLVKDLASVFRCRIELRQMGIRDEAKSLGGLGICGRPFCCNAFLPDFVQVSIKMAKEQSLSLNSAKISGSCGRLMCCLRYEYDTYVEELSRTPKLDSVVKTPEGEGVVIEVMPLEGKVKVRLTGEPSTQKTWSRDEVTVMRNKKIPQSNGGNNTPDE